MSQTSLDSRYLLRWDFSHELAVDRDLVLASHRLTDLPFLTDWGLRELMARVPSSALVVNMMGQNPAHPTEWQLGLLGDVAPSQVIDLINHGRFWFTAPRIDMYQTQMANLVARLSRELNECHVGLRIIEPHADLVLSSPSAQYYYSCDPHPSVLWHLRGRMRLRVYPNDSRFIQQSDRQLIASRQTSERLYFEPSLDRYSRVFELQPGQMISWPQGCPYRIENLEVPNISLRLTFQTPRSIRQEKIHLVNRILTSLKADRWCDDRIDGLSASFKVALAHLIRGAGKNSNQHAQHPTFWLDADSPSGARWLPGSTQFGEVTTANEVTNLNVGSFPGQLQPS
jgi:hypothetical protein